MSTDLKALSGVVKVHVKGQEARPAWMQKLLQEALANGQGADNELRFQCRIAQDANVAFEEVRLSDGTVITLNPKGHAQFGRNSRGNAYLTVGVIWSKDDAPYRLQWEGDAVPLKMQQVAVKHDEGKRVPATVIGLKLQAATVSKVRHDLTKTGAVAQRAPRTNRPTASPKRKHDRLCAADLPQ